MVHRFSSLMLISGLTLVLGLCAPARADFFDDAGFALNKLGHGINDLGKEVVNQSQNVVAQVQEVTGLATDKTPNAAADDQFEEVTWQKPIPKDQLYLTSRPTDKLTLASRLPFNKGSQTSSKDDAPAPRAAPKRAVVEVVATLSAPEGFTEAPPSTFKPAPPAASQPMTSVKSALLLPKPRPAALAVVDAVAAAPAPVVAASVMMRQFSLIIQDHSFPMSDAVIGQSAPKPDAKTELLLKTLATVLKEPNVRLRLTAQATETAADTNARQRAFMRAQVIKGWLEALGVRSTQIDLLIMGAGSQDSVILTPYQVQ